MQSPTLYIEGEPCLLSHQAIVKKFLLLAAVKEEEDLLHTITISKEGGGQGSLIRCKRIYNF
jgi:hypothetical protein